MHPCIHSLTPNDTRVIVQQAKKISCIRERSSELSESPYPLRAKIIGTRKVKTFGYLMVLVLLSLQNQVYFRALYPGRL